MGIRIVLTAVSAYLLGSLSFAIIVSRALLKKDIRELGSGNAGLTNAYRNMGPAGAALVLAGDFGKGMLACYLGGVVMDLDGKLLAGVFVMLGHLFPLYFGFKGGKGILTTCGVLLIFDWRVCCTLLSIFLILAIVTRYISLGSVTAAAAFPFVMYYFHHNWIYTLVALGIGGIVLWSHRSNITRLIKGTESKFTWKVPGAGRK